MELPTQYVYRTPARTRSISISIRNGAVIVTSPRFVPAFFVKRFVARSQEWIRKHLKADRKTRERRLQLEKNGTILMFGEEFVVENVFGSSGTGGVRLVGSTLHVHPVENTKSSIEKAIQRWRNAQLETYIVKRAHEIAKRMDVRFSTIAFRTQATRWGSCSINGTLHFNYKLAGAPKDVVDYVIIHELAHITHMHHGREFWRRVEHFDSDYKSHRQWLKHHGALL